MPPLSGTGRPARTIFGGSAKPPEAHNTPRELDPYRGLSQAEVFDAFNEEQAALLRDRQAPIWNAFHGYDSGNMPTTYSASQCAQIIKGRRLVAVQNCKLDQRGLLAGQHDNRIATLVRSCRADQRTYLGINHEPENDGGFDPGLWRASSAHFAKVVIDSRGDLPVIPMVCVINYNLHPRNGSFDEESLNLAPELDGEGVDLGDVVYTTDGYDTSPIEKGGAAHLYVNGANGKPGVFPLLRSWGFTRLGVSEGACKSHTPSDRALAASWITDMGALMVGEGAEYFLWFNSGVGDRAGPEGWWLYGDEAKKAWAKLTRRTLKSR